MGRGYYREILTNCSSPPIRTGCEEKDEQNFLPVIKSQSEVLKTICHRINLLKHHFVSLAFAKLPWFLTATSSHLTCSDHCGLALCLGRLNAHDSGPHAQRSSLCDRPSVSRHVQCQDPLQKLMGAASPRMSPTLASPPPTAFKT